MRVTFSLQVRLRRAPRSPCSLAAALAAGKSSVRSASIHPSSQSKDGLASTGSCAANQSASLRKAAACSGRYCFSQPLARLEQSALVSAAMQSAGLNQILIGLVTEGVLGGIGSVLSFLPIIIVLFLLLSILEDSGYLARVAFVMDKLLRRIGLSGRSIVPLLVGFGCTVPAVMATRTLPSERDRKMTILLTPFMSCSAKLPIYGFFVNAFFREWSWAVMLALYLGGILTGVLVALLYKKTIFKGEAVPFVMELPNYRLPGAKNVMHLLWEKAKDFLVRAFTVIFIATIVVWLLKTFNWKFNPVQDSSDSMLAQIAGFIAPVFVPLGMGDWRIVTALISGVLAKESVVAMLKVLYEGGIEASFGAATAAAILTFSLLYTPCVAAIAAVRRELGAKWAGGMVVWQCVVAYLAATVVHLIMMLCVGG